MLIPHYVLSLTKTIFDDSTMLLALLIFLPAALAETIAEIQGNTFKSPLVGRSVTNVSGLVTAKSASAGFWIALTDSSSDAAIQVFTADPAVLSQVTPGDIVTLDAKVSEFLRLGNDYVNSLTLTELTSPTNIRKLSSGNTVTPIVVGADGLHPPTQQSTSLDVGGPLTIPNDASKLMTANPTLQPTQYGLDFWESLVGKLVKVTVPTSLGRPNRFKDFWIRGDWPSTGVNARGGLTVNLGSDGLPDLNPEAVVVGKPLDGTSNPDVRMGTTVSEIVGVVTYDFEFYRILPLTAPTVLANNDAVQGPTTLTVPENDAGCTLTFGDYNVENLSWNSDHLPTAASQIADFLKTPDIVFLQEIQDDSGGSNNGVVTSNRTMDALVDAIASRNGVRYSHTYISPSNNQDGGANGGNIRVAFLYRPERLKLVNPNYGGPLDKTEVVNNNGKLALTFNPGRIDPSNSAWEGTRKPLVALFESIASGQQVIAINIHDSSKSGDDSSLHGNPRPPINYAVQKRLAQVPVIADFVKSILALKSDAAVIVSGDFNEFIQLKAVFDPLTAHLKSIDDAANTPAEERYTYLFNGNAQQLDLAFISPKLQPGAEVEHLHINTWSRLGTRTPDHDPSVSRVKLC